MNSTYVSNIFIDLTTSDEIGYEANALDDPNELQVEDPPPQGLRTQGQEQGGSLVPLKNSLSDMRCSLQKVSTLAE